MTGRRGGGLALLSLLLLGTPDRAFGQEFAWPVVPCATGRFEIALNRACRGIGLQPRDIRFREDYLPVDSFRLSHFNRWFREPLCWPGEMDRSSHRLIEGSWKIRLEQLAAWGDFESPEFPQSPVHPALRGSVASSWKDRRPPPAYRGALRRMERVLPFEARQWLSRLIQLQVAIHALKNKGIEPLDAKQRKTLRSRTMRLFREDAEEKEMGEGEIEEMLDLLSKASWRQWCGGALAVLSERIDPLLATPVPAEDALRGLKGMLLDWDTPWGKVWVGGVDAQVYELPARGDVLILDLGGDDVYRISKEGREPGAFEYLADLGGNDRYEASAAFGFGATFGGFSFLYDRRGNDVYEGPMLNFGVGLLGVGVCIDEEGNDVYRCASGGLGAALAGAGLLADAGGNDEYLGHSGVQGVGGPAGAAALVDLAGDDLYVAGNAFPDGIERQPRGYINFSQGFGFGLRPYCSGGIGVLADGAGDDRYLSSYFAQGSSYWFGAGALCDRSGNDNYQALRYSQGAGIHLGLGLLFDGAGHDVYTAWGVSQGCGHDLAAGLLWDSEGNDLYRGSWLYGGAGNANGFGLLVDCAGDDYYLPGPADVPGQSMALGWGSWAADREMDSLGFLLDLSGKDSYGPLDLDGLHRVVGDVGVLVDLRDD